MKKLPLFFLLLLGLSGCSTTFTYKAANPDAPKLDAKPDDYPIPVYTKQMTIPRPVSVIGRVTIDDSRFTTFGGSIDGEMKKVMAKAHEQGADAVKMVDILKPGFNDSNYRLKVDLLRYSDAWETINITAAEFSAYLKANQTHLDPIEGIWDGRSLVPHYIGIMRDHSKPGREFVGFILGSENPAWKKGYKKMDIQPGKEPGTYILNFYLENFSARRAIVTLGANYKFTLAIQKSDDDSDSSDYVTYYKNW